MLEVGTNKIKMTDSIEIHKDEIDWDFKKASNPGGMAANSQSTGVQLRFNLDKTDSLPNEVKDRLFEIADNKITNENILILNSDEHRSQQLNREECIDKLRELIEEAANPPKERKTTKPPSGDENEERLKEKKIQGRLKELRKPIQPEDIDNV